MARMTITEKKTRSRNNCLNDAHSSKTKNRNVELDALRGLEN